jgi:hypothetical protein
VGQDRVRGDCTRMAAESPHPGCGSEASREFARDSLAWRVAVLACLIAALSGCAGSGGLLASLPQPQDVSIIPPPAGLAPQVAAFWGMWEGYWRGPSGVLPSRLIVERIDSESAEVVYVWGDDPQGHFKAGWGRFKAKVLPRGILEFGWRRTTLVFEMREDRKSIEGGRVQGSTISAATMRRVGP